MDTPLQYLARRAFPDYRLLAPEHFPAGFEGAASRVKASPERQAEFQIWWTAHASMPIGEIDRLVAVERAKEQQARDLRGRLKETQRFFNRSTAHGEFEHWARMAYWTIEEAVALSLGKNPEIVNWASVESHTHADIEGFVSDFARNYAQRRQVAKRAVPWNELLDPVLPVVFIRWAERNGYSFPPDLRALIEARGPVLDWKDVYDKQVATSASLQLALTSQGEALAKQKRAAEDWKKDHAEVATKVQGLVERLTAVTAEREALIRSQLNALKTAAAPPWPWGEHDTELLQHLAAAARQWWVNFDPTDKTTAPTNEQVEGWLTARTLSNGKPIATRVAEIMAQILRLDGLPTGPRT